MVETRWREALPGSGVTSECVDRRRVRELMADGGARKVLSDVEDRPISPHMVLVDQEVHVEV